MAGTSGAEELRELWTFGRCGFRIRGRGGMTAGKIGTRETQESCAREYARRTRGGSAGMAGEV